MRITAKAIEHHLRNTGATSVGDTERLAGIDTSNRAERMRAWGKFQHLRQERFSGERQDPCCAAAMRECHKIAAQMVNSGKMSLVSFNAHRLQ